jgi:hypothetical protein
MKFNAAVATVSAAILAGSAHADKPDESPVVPELPTFTVSREPPTLVSFF